MWIIQYIILSSFSPVHEAKTDGRDLVKSRGLAPKNVTSMGVCRKVKGHARSVGAFRPGWHMPPGLWAPHPPASPLQDQH